MCCKSMRVLKFVLLLCTTVALALSVAVGYFSSSQSGLAAGRSIGLFVDWNTSVTWSDRGTYKNSSITPTSWTFTVWIVIYVYQLLWLAYCWTTLCRRLHADANFLCNDPDLAPIGLLVWHFLTSLLNIAWILLADRIDFDRTLLIPQTCVLFAIVICLACCLISSYWNLARSRDVLASHGRHVDFWLTVILVQNGISMYAAWTTVASFINLDLVLIFKTPLESSISSFACLSVLIGLIAAYVVADLTTLDRLTRFVFTPHLIVAWACAGSLAKNFYAWSVNSILTVLLICIVGVGMLLKLVCICVRTRTSPLLRSQVYHLKQTA